MVLVITVMLFNADGSIDNGGSFLRSVRNDRGSPVVSIAVAARGANPDLGDAPAVESMGVVGDDCPNNVNGDGAGDPAGAMESGGPKVKLEMFSQVCTTIGGTTCDGAEVAVADGSAESGVSTPSG